MMQELFIIIIIIIILGIMVCRLSNVLWRGIEPMNSFSGARAYARLAVASWTTLDHVAAPIPPKKPLKVKISKKFVK